MDTTIEKLINCFSLVFPRLPVSQIPVATADNIAEWDSIAQINLMSIAAEEFDIDPDYEQFEGATSFEAFLERLRQITTAAQ